MFFTVIKIWLKHDWQRPASWVSLCLAGCAVMTIPKMTIPGVWGLPLFFWGILASAAAIGMGEVSATLPLWSFRSHARKWAFGSFTRSVSALPHGLSWYVVRLLWPTIGCVSGLIVKAIVGQNDQVQQATLLLEGIVIIVLTAGTFFTFLVSGFPIADAYSGVLLTGWSAIAIVGWSFSCMPPWLIWAVPFILVMVWLGAGLVLLLLGAEVFSSSYPDIFGSILLRNRGGSTTFKREWFLINCVPRDTSSSVTMAAHFANHCNRVTTSGYGRLASANEFRRSKVRNSCEYCVRCDSNSICLVVGRSQGCFRVGLSFVMQKTNQMVGETHYTQSSFSSRNCTCQLWGDCFLAATRGVSGCCWEFWSR